MFLIILKQIKRRRYSCIRSKVVESPNVKARFDRRWENEKRKRAREQKKLVTVFAEIEFDKFIMTE